MAYVRKTKPDEQQEPSPMLTTDQYRSQMQGFQIGAFGGGMDESLKGDAFYQSGYKDGQGVRSGYAKSLKNLVAKPEANSNPGSLSGAQPASYSESPS